MERVRTVVAYRNYFKEFLLEQTPKVQDKIFKIIEIIEFQERIPSKYLKQIKGAQGLYEARISFSSDIWRVFCFFDKDRLVILLNGFQKKTQKTPKSEIERAEKLMNEYFYKKEDRNETE